MSKKVKVKKAHPLADIADKLRYVTPAPAPVPGATDEELIRYIGKAVDELLEMRIMALSLTDAWDAMQTAVRPIRTQRRKAQGCSI